MAMSPEKLTEVLDRYEHKAKDIIADYETYDGSEYPRDMDAADKVLAMIPACREFLAANRREKLMRWLGFMQGAWWLADVYTLEELKNHNRPDEE